MGGSASIQSIETLSPEEIANFVSSNLLNEKYSNYITNNIIKNRITGELLNNINDHEEFNLLINSLEIKKVSDHKKLYSHFKSLEKVFNNNNYSSHYHSSGSANNSSINNNSGYNWFTLKEKLSLSPNELIKKLLNKQQENNTIYLNRNNNNNKSNTIQQISIENITNEIIKIKNSLKNYKYDCFISFNYNSDLDIAINLYYSLKSNGINPYFYNIFVNNYFLWKDFFLEGY